MPAALQMTEMPVEALSPNPWNTNVVSPENEAKLRASFKRFGCYKPIIVRQLPDNRLQILGGEHRWRTAKDLGYATVPVVNLGVLSDAKAKEIGLVDNARYGDDDTLQLAELMKELAVEDNLTDFLPYDERELASLLAAPDIDIEALLLGDDDGPGLPEATKPQVTHQLMRFKVPLDDAAWVAELIEKTMKVHNFTGDDALTNAGDALVQLLKKGA